MMMMKIPLTQLVSPTMMMMGEEGSVMRMRWNGTTNEDEKMEEAGG